MLCFHSQRFRTKFLAYTDPDRFTDAGLYPNAQPDLYRDSGVTDENYSQPDSNSQSNSYGDTDRNAYAFARILSEPRHYCDTNSKSNSNACGCVACRSDGCPSKVFFLHCS